jgi:hypothetical protein
VLRSAALSDSRVIALVNEAFVPVWINVRTHALPPLPVLEAVLVNAKVDGGNKISDPFSRGFFVRSVVLSPDGGRILNKAPRTIAGSLQRVAMYGDLSYAEVNPGEYLVMLRRALERQQTQ